MKELDQRITALRQLLDGEIEPKGRPRRPTGEPMPGHQPEHAAPGPLLDDLTTPATVVHIDLAHQRPPLHAVGSASDLDEVASAEVAQVIRLQA